MKRKIIAAALTALMLCGTALPVYAANKSPNTTVSQVNGENKEELKKAITVVKQRYKVPDEYSEFDYYDYGGRYELTWSDPKNGRSISAETDGTVIYSLNVSDKNSDNVSAKFGKLSDEQLKAIAAQWIKKLDPQIKYGIKTEIDSRYLWSQNISISFSLTSGGIAINGLSGNVTLDRDTGDLVSMSISKTDVKNLTLISADKMKSETELANIIKSNMELKPYYRYEYSDGKAYGRLYYDVSFKSDISMLDAFTGKPSTIDKDKAKFGIKGNSSEVSAGMGIMEDDDIAYEESADADYDFTERELVALELDKSLIQKGDIANYLKNDPIIVFDKDLSLEYAEITDHFIDENVKIDCWDLKYTAKRKGSTVQLNVLMNARTGQIITFNKDITYDHEVQFMEMSVEDGVKLADKAAKHFTGEDFSSFKLTKKPSEKTFKGSADFVYSRYVNGIEVKGDTVTVTVRSNKSVFAYNSNYITNAEYEDASKLISESKAKEKAVRYNPPTIAYEYFFDKDGKCRSYIIQRYNTDFIIDGVTGRPQSTYYWAKNSFSGTPEYTDIKGTETEKYVNKLADYDIIFTENEAFDPQHIITEKEFAEIFGRINNHFTPYYYDMPEEEQTEYSDKAPANNLFLAKFYVDNLTDCSEAAKLKSIYKSPFTDIPETYADCGYIAIAKAMGFASGNGGKFDPNKTYTRAEAAKLIYVYLSSSGGNLAIIHI